MRQRISGRSALFMQIQVLKGGKVQTQSQRIGRQTLLLGGGGGGGGGCLSLFAAPPPLPCTSPLAAAPPLLLGFAPALSDLALLPLDGFGTGAASELRLQFDHAGADGVSFAAGLVALGPLGPLGDHAVDRWRGE